MRLGLCLYFFKSLINDSSGGGSSSANCTPLATLWGDPASGTFGAFFRLPAGFTAPLHTHTHRMKVVVVSGTYIQEPEGSPVFRLRPGSYLMQPGGTYRHTTSCDTTSDCVIFVESDGAFDLFAAEGAEL